VALLRTCRDAQRPIDLCILQAANLVFLFSFFENGIETNPEELYMKLFKILLSRPSPVQEHGQELNRSTDKSCRKDISQRTVCAEEGGWSSWCS